MPADGVRRHNEKRHAAICSNFCGHYDAVGLAVRSSGSLAPTRRLGNVPLVDVGSDCSIPEFVSSLRVVRGQGGIRNIKGVEGTRSSGGQRSPRSMKTYTIQDVWSALAIEVWEADRC